MHVLSHEARSMELNSLEGHYRHLTHHTTKQSSPDTTQTISAVSLIAVLDSQAGYPLEGKASREGKAART